MTRPEKANADTRSVSPSRAAPQIPTLPALYDKSWALVIGINDYGERHARLANARNDAEAVGALLRDEYAFDRVTSLYDAEASHGAILEWLRDGLPSLAGPNDRVVIFFAGHGTTREGARGYSRGYMIPQDAVKSNYSDYVDMTELCDACGWIKAKHVLIILDCCFSGVAAVTARAAPAPPPEVLSDAYLKGITQRPAWQVLTAGASDELAADSGSRPGHSAFTGALLSGLEGQADQNGDGIITAIELANYVKPQVMRETTTAWREGQSPFFNYLAGSGQGDFVFLRPDRPVRTTQKTLPVWWQTGSVFRLPYWLWGVLAAILLLLGGLAWTVWGPKPARSAETAQASPTAQVEASATVRQVAALAGQTITAAAFKTTEAVAAKTADTRASSTAAAVFTATAEALAAAATGTAAAPPPTLAPSNTPLPTWTPTPVCLEAAGLFAPVWQQVSPRLGCPETALPSDEGLFAEQPFQHGHMFWIGKQDLFLVTIGSESGTWLLFKGTDSPWAEGMPEYSCTQPPPSGTKLVQPKRGFGRLWCKYALSKVLGWGTDIERGLTGEYDLFQRFSNGILFRDSDGKHNRKVYVLYEDDDTFVRLGY